MPATKAEAVLHLKSGRDRSVRRRHPWIFSGAVARLEGEAGPGDTVRVQAADGSVLGRAAYSPSSQIRARLWTHDATTAVDEAMVRGRLDQALALRRRFVLGADTNCARLVFAEGDGLPSMVADLYDDTLVLQCHSAGAERFQDLAIAHLVERTGARRVVLRSDAEVRKLEGLELKSGVVAGPPVEGGVVRARENGVHFLVDVERGHKTGFYLDQRDSRARLRAVARGRVLNCFSYTGGFAVSALCGGAERAVSVDTSQAALELAERNVAENGIAESRHEGLRGDCFDVLRGLFDEGERFDVVVLDPPKFAPAARHVEKASRGYKDLALRALKLLSPGGLLFSFSCSGAIDRELFRQIAASASLEAGRPLQLLGDLGHPPDHPVPAHFAEGEYLKGYWALAS